MTHLFLKLSFICVTLGSITAVFAGQAPPKPAPAEKGWLLGGGIAIYTHTYCSFAQVNRYIELSTLTGNFYCAAKYIEEGGNNKSGSLWQEQEPGHKLTLRQSCDLFPLSTGTISFSSTDCTVKQYGLDTFVIAPWSFTVDPSEKCQCLPNV